MFVYTMGRGNVIILNSKIILIDKYNNIFEIDLDVIDKKSSKILIETI